MINKQNNARDSKHFSKLFKTNLPSKMILGGVLKEKPLPGNRDNQTEGFEGVPTILKNSNDQ